MMNLKTELRAVVRKTAQKPVKTLKNLRFIGAYLAFINTGGTKAAHKLEEALAGMAKPEDFVKLAAEMRQLPALQEMFETQYIPPSYTLEDLKVYQPGTLGYAYYHHMVDNGLGIDYYPVPKPDDALGYFRMRAVQAHDLWHVIAGLEPIPTGEMGILYFNMGHYARHLGHLAPSMMSLLSILVSGGMMNILAKHPDDLIGSLEIQGRGYTAGYNAAPLFAGQWESWFDQPLAEIRQRYNVIPVNPVYNYTSEAPISQQNLVGVS
jgi:ubiquinone biosynthesis protein Coq4